MHQMFVSFVIGKSHTLTSRVIIKTIYTYMYIVFVFDQPVMCLGSRHSKCTINQFGSLYLRHKMTSACIRSKVKISVPYKYKIIIFSSNLTKLNNHHYIQFCTSNHNYFTSIIITTSPR